MSTLLFPQNMAGTEYWSHFGSASAHRSCLTKRCPYRCEESFLRVDLGTNCSLLGPLFFGSLVVLQDAPFPSHSSDGVKFATVRGGEPEAAKASSSFVVFDVPILDFHHGRVLAICEQPRVQRPISGLSPSPEAQQRNAANISPV